MNSTIRIGYDFIIIAHVGDMLVARWFPVVSVSVPNLMSQQLPYIETLAQLEFAGLSLLVRVPGRALQRFLPVHVEGIPYLGLILIWGKPIFFF